MASPQEVDLSVDNPLALFPSSVWSGRHIRRVAVVFSQRAARCPVVPKAHADNERRPRHTRSCGYCPNRRWLLADQDRARERIGRVRRSLLARAGSIS